MTDLPTGTVAFLFTDIEGSTRLWQEQPEAMRPALARHDELVRDATELHAGHVVKTTGDGVLAVFATASDAIGAAVTAQLALGSEAWSLSEPVRVRMGIHVGPAELRDGDYFGTSVNRTARLMSVAHGGQIVISLATEELIGDDLPPDVGLLDLGEHELRDVVRPEHVFQLVHPALPRTFPRLRTQTSVRGNLPSVTSAFVGREREIAAIGDLVREGPLVTLVGVGGVGKTRLSLEVAARSRDRFPDGAWFVPLAGVGDEALFGEGVASALGVTQRPGATLDETLLDHVRDKRMLLVLDNCEHLVAPACDFVGQALSVAPDLRVLVTSREGLGVAGEHVVPVPVLGAPAADATVDELRTADAVRLFVVRASEAAGGSDPSDDEVRDIALLCRRLDGIPLAIELAAARRRSMTPAEIADHLDQRFRVLTGGRRTALSRHQTMRSAIDWSYDLLGAREQSLLHHLAVFAGSFDLAGVQAVAASPDLDVFDVVDVLGQLVDKSLVVAETRRAHTRYRLFDTVRDYAWERLEHRDEVEEVSRRHAEHYVAFAEAASRGLTGADEIEWVDRVREELDNLQTALRWAIAGADADLALRLVAGLTSSASAAANPFGSLAEDAAELPDATGHVLRPVALASAAYSFRLTDPARALELAEAAVATSDAAPGDVEHLRARCIALGALAGVLSSAFASTPRASAVVDEFLVEARQLDDPYLLIQALNLATADPTAALAAAEEALAYAQQIMNPSRLAFALLLLARVVSRTDAARARRLLEDAVTYASSVGHRYATDFALQILSLVEAAEGDYGASAVTLVTAAERALWAGDQNSRNLVFNQLARALAALGRDDAALVFGAWAARREFTVSVYDEVAEGEVAEAFGRLTERASPEQLRAAAIRAETMSDRELLDLARRALAEEPDRRRREAP